MKELIDWIRTHKQFYNKNILKYITQEVTDISLKYNLSIIELCYRLKNNIPLDKIFTCKSCGKPIAFKRTHGGYQDHCSIKCANKSQELRNIRKQTCLNKYGVTCYAKTSECQEKIKQTYINKYGVDSYFKTKECIQKSHSKVTQEKRKQTCLNKYGTEYYQQTNEFKDFMKEHKGEIQDKVKQTYQKKYGVDNYRKTQEYKDCMQKQRQHIKDVTMQTNLNKYGVDHYSKTQEYKDRAKCTNLERYGKENYTQTDEWKEFYKQNQTTILEKQYDTKKQNNTFNSSSFEEDTYKLLLTKFNKEDIVRQYRSNSYPFSCDFYIKSKDLYIECNGTWTHGSSSFNKDNKEHLEILNKWQIKAVKSNYFKNAIYTWTDLDVRKLECFKKNNLNYKIFWNIDEVKKFIEGD